MKQLWIFSTLIFSIFFFSCNEEKITDIIPGSSSISDNEETLRINRFIHEGMHLYYLWDKHIPSYNYNNESDPVKYFYKILYKDDHWSFITDDYEALSKSFNGIEKSFGYSLAFGAFSGTENEVFAIVEYVYPNTPASQAGLKRGDIIIKLNKRIITTNNYTDLLYSDNIEIELGKTQGNSITPSGDSYILNATEISLNPILLSKIIDYKNKKFGYLVYNQFIEKYNNQLNEVFREFKTAGIDHLILDLRYNPGGDNLAAINLCSNIAPLDKVSENKIIVKNEWNDANQQYLEANKDEYGDLIESRFNKDITDNLDLDEVHILTGKGTASASELTIAGLKPYMNVTLVGDTTHGKYTSSITIIPEFLAGSDDYPNIYNDTTYTNPINNWAIQPIVAHYKNSLGDTFKDGFAPDLYEEDILIPAYPLGNISEPLLKKALEDITGKVMVSMKKAPLPVSVKIIDRGFSKYDPLKQTLNLGEFKIK